MGTEVKKKKAALLSNITADLIAAKLRKKYDFYIPEGFDTWVQDILNPASALYTGECDAVFLLLDGTEARSWKSREEGEDRINTWKQAAAFLLDRVKNIPVFVSTIDIRENRIRSMSERMFAPEMENDWYQYIQSKAETAGNLYILDLAGEIRETGRKQFYSNKMWYMSSMPYSREGLNTVVKAVDRALEAAFSGRKKLIALDLDNTLWGGVVGEDGVEGIELSDHKEGQRFYDFQRGLLEMKKRGILLAINSKNNEEDAEEAVRNHPSMVLRDEDFAIRKINWENKASNLISISDTLNITQGGFIFIDDNPVEREVVRGECPEILVPDFPEDTTGLIDFAEELWLDYCRPLRVLGEDLQKTQMYQSEARRKEVLAHSLNLEDYIARLGITVDIHRMRAEETERVAQLCGKTNQFNVTARRYSRAEIEAMGASDDCDVFVVHSADKYGDNGLVSVLILASEGEDTRIDTFLMSCRVMGRQLENLIFQEIAAAQTGRRRIIGEYLATPRNTPVKNLYDSLGFTVLSGDENHRFYAFEMKDFRKKQFPAYKEIKTDLERS